MPGFSRSRRWIASIGQWNFPQTLQLVIALLSLVDFSTATTGNSKACTSSPETLYLNDGPYNNYFYADCHTAAQVLVTSPLPDSNLSLISPRFIVAWPAGNSGLVAYFAPKNGKNGTLSINIVNTTDCDFAIQPIYEAPMAGNANPIVGVSGQLHMNSSNYLDLSILGSIREVRDFTEGGSTLTPQVQNAIKTSVNSDGTAVISRLWLDNITTTTLTFQPVSKSGHLVTKSKLGKLLFEAGTYQFDASFDYPQLEQLPRLSLFTQGSQSLMQSQKTETTALSFLSYNNKLLAGGWRFLTYFGRDTMISLLLLFDVVSDEVREAVISAVLERVNATSGQVCHEETIGDYATLQNLEAGKNSTAPSCSYIMIDSDYYLPIVMEMYEKSNPSRFSALLDRNATQSFNPGVPYRKLALLNAELIVNKAAAFATPGKQTEQNLRHLEPDQVVGTWRDSTYGIGGGRIPMDVNTGLVPAALNAISALSECGAYGDSHPNWAKKTKQYAQVWEDKALQFFEVSVPRAEAETSLKSYVKESSFPGPLHLDQIPDTLTYYALALKGNNNQSVVKVMNTDICFRLFLVNGSSTTPLTKPLNTTANHILSQFPAGLSTSTGLFVANPAYGGNPIYAANWTNTAYHGTVIWSWPLAMLAKGLERQLTRCPSSTQSKRLAASAGQFVPEFCSDEAVYANVRKAYNHLWDLIDENQSHINQEVWTWNYKKSQGFQYVDYGSISPTGKIRKL